MIKNLMLIMIGLIVIIILFGCVRTTTYLKERVDQEVSGNRGYLQGLPSPAQEKVTTSNRKMINVEIELPPYSGWEKYERKDKELLGNRGFLLSGPSERKMQPKEEFKKEKETKSKAVIEESEEESDKEEISLLTYTVKKGETLQDISARVYGSTQKWPMIYEANKDKIKEPDRIHPGQVLRIPKIKYSK